MIKNDSTENLVTIKKKTINKKDLFKIETLTLAPYDVDLIISELQIECGKINWFVSEILQWYHHHKIHKHIHFQKNF